MIDESALANDLKRIGLGNWIADLLPVVHERLSPQAHGDLPAWTRTLDELKHCPDQRDREALLQSLKPWRKGPFKLGDITIDAEWRSDFKWQRVSPHLSPLAGRNILDVGCGNGWYALQMLDGGARTVIGIDPTILFVVQFAAIASLSDRTGAHVLPVRLEDLPPESHAFDTTFSMGVLYHRINPGAHLAQLIQTLRPGGELVLETLVIPGEHWEVFIPEGRYARMRNVHHLPTTSALRDWVVDAGFRNVRIVDVTQTTTDEQRRTPWMTFESLEHALDADDPTRTIEGLPAPTRAILLAEAP